MAWNLSKLTDEEKAEMYKKMASKSYADIAIEHKIDIHYSSPQGYRNAVWRVKKEVEAQPEKFGITSDITEMVNEAAADRKSNAHKLVGAREQREMIDFDNFSEVTLTARNKAGEILHKKLDLLGNNKKALEKVNLVQLTTAFGTLFDKARILKGEATENIAIKAKLSADVSPEEALEQILKQRELRQEDKYDK